MQEMCHQSIDSSIFKEEGTTDLFHAWTQGLCQLEHQNGIQAISDQRLGGIDLRTGKVEHLCHHFLQIGDAFLPQRLVCVVCRRDRALCRSLCRCRQSLCRCRRFCALCQSRVRLRSKVEI